MQQKSPATFGKAFFKTDFLKSHEQFFGFRSKPVKHRPTTLTGVRYANGSVFNFDCNRCAHITARKLVTKFESGLLWRICPVIIACAFSTRKGPAVKVGFFLFELGVQTSVERNTPANYNFGAL